MITPGPGVRVYLATQPCDMRKGMDGLAAQVQNVLAADPFSGALFVFRGKRGDILKILAWDGSGLCLFAKRLEQGRFVWPPTVEGPTDPGSTRPADRGHRLATHGRAGPCKAARVRLIIF